MRYRVMAAVFLIWITAFCQSTLLEYLEIFNVRPNILIVLMVIVALLRSTVESAAMGLLFGLTMDILMGKTLGWYALLFFLVSIPISMINDKLYREKFLVLITFAFSSTVLIETVFFLIIFMFRGYSYLPYLFGTVIVPEAIYNSILILPLFKPVSKAYNLLDTVDRRRNRLPS
ncbi:MAG TPA: rod shape-determining protein MreD [Clostridiaceae bacterium]|jgi:rod shape-determining protein MreD|nr:rod shape-determining protein MreD [Clostridiaceae bacterium]